MFDREGKASGGAMGDARTDLRRGSEFVDEGVDVAGVYVSVLTAGMFVKQNGDTWRSRLEREGSQHDHGGQPGHDASLSHPVGAYHNVSPV